MMERTLTGSLLAISPDGGRGACVYSRPGRLVVWDLRTGETVNRFDLQSSTTEFRTMQMLDRDHVAVSGEDMTIRIWNVTTGREVHRIQADSHCQQRFDFTSDRRRVVSAGGWTVRERLATDGDYGIRIWSVPDSTQ